MNRPRGNARQATQTANGSRSVPPAAGICTHRIDGCRGNGETSKATLCDREVFHPGPFGVLAGNSDGSCSVGYSHGNVAGRALGAQGLPEQRGDRSDDTLLAMVSTETHYGAGTRVRMRLPILVGAPGSAGIAWGDWEHFATGAAIAGITIVCGADVCGADPGLEMDSRGKVKKAPNLARRIEQYRRYQEGYGDVIVRMSVEDTRLGVAEYVIGGLGVESVELKWGRNAGRLDGAIRVESLERALELGKRGYVVTPDPSHPAHQAAFRDGALKHFERYSRLGFVDQAGFMKEVERVRKLGAKHVTLRTGAYPMRDLALAIKWASDAGLDLLTIDGALGGTDRSLWRTMEGGGVPAFYLESMIHDLCRDLAARGRFAPDVAIAEGVGSAEHVFNILATGAPYAKAVCVGRTPMIPGITGRNIGPWLQETADALPETAGRFGTTIEEISVCYEDLVARYGKETAGRLPLGAVGLYAYCDKIKVGLRQLMAASRNFNVSTISRDDVMTLTPEAAQVSGLTHIMDADREEADKIIRS